MMKHAHTLGVPLAAAAFVMMAGSSAALATITATMCVNYNGVDELVITTDGDTVRQTKIQRGDSKFTKDRFRKAAKELGFMGSSHTISPWTPGGSWPPGTYDFKAKDADDVQMETTATLTACISDKPKLHSIEDEFHAEIEIEDIV